MEKRKNQASLPSNYVTLAQLQERWLKQQAQTNQEEEKPLPPNQNQNHHKVVVASTSGTASRSLPQKHCVVKTRNDSATHRNSESAAGNATVELDGKVSESKKKKKNRKVKPEAKTEEGGASGEGSAAAQGNKEAEKATIQSELNENKGGSEVEQRVRVLSVNSRNAKRNGGLGKTNNGDMATTEEVQVQQRVRVLPVSSGNGKQNRGLGKSNNGGSATMEEVQQKVRVSPLNSGNGKDNGGSGKTKNGDSATTKEVEQRVRILPMKSENGKQNGELGKRNNRFGHSQYQRKYNSRGNLGYRNGSGYCQHSKVVAQNTEKMVWVRKTL
ncbi:uncharacterized protein LOC109807695 [Cajanus cajan]|uniref:uncharacterized protein LOC109807695 n=1 Tax=Cajanus cajan TaxID=3821 RepID=UPI00098DD4EF|nr:uncharacterized protein LOC109807695 [Cajanus cajan]